MADGVQGTQNDVDARENVNAEGWMKKRKKLMNSWVDCYVKLNGKHLTYGRNNEVWHILSLVHFIYIRGSTKWQCKCHPAGCSSEYSAGRIFKID